MLFISSIYVTAIRYVTKATRAGIKLTNIKEDEGMSLGNDQFNRPTPAYVYATWGVLAVGVLGYLMGLWHADLALNEKGYYFTGFLFSMFAAITLQKTVRDKQEGFPVTKVFVGMCWVAFSSSIALLVIGLVNADMFLSEKGFYAMSFVLSLFAVITVQKNIRDLTNEYGETDPSAFPKSSVNIDTALDAADIID